MEITAKVSIHEIILRGDWPEEWIEQFKDSILIHSMLNIKAQDGMGLQVREEQNSDGETLVNLEKYKCP